MVTVYWWSQTKEEGGHAEPSTSKKVPRLVLKQLEVVIRGEVTVGEFMWHPGVWWLTLLLDQQSIRVCESSPPPAAAAVVPGPKEAPVLMLPHLKKQCLLFQRALITQLPILSGAGLPAPPHYVPIFCPKSAKERVQLQVITNEGLTLKRSATQTPDVLLLTLQEQSGLLTHWFQNNTACIALLSLLSTEPLSFRSLSANSCTITSCSECHHTSECWNWKHLQHPTGCSDQGVGAFHECWSGVQACRRSYRRHLSAVQAL